MRREIGPVLVAVLAGCMLTGGGSDWGPGSRRYYLTRETVQGNKTLDACARHYHMASRFEIHDVSALRYDTTVGLSSDDAGTGPPGRAAAYGSEDAMGWVRTGGSARFTDPGDPHGSASTNCSAWSTNSPEAFGTVAHLSDRFTLRDGSAAPLWDGGSERCNVPHHVWCIEDRPSGAAGSEEEERHGRHGRQRGSDLRP